MRTSDRSLICIIQRLRFSGFILYPLSFFLYSPFKYEKLFKPCDSRHAFMGHLVPDSGVYFFRINWPAALGERGNDFWLFEEKMKNFTLKGNFFHSVWYLLPEIRELQRSINTYNMRYFPQHFLLCTSTVHDQSGSCE